MKAQGQLKMITEITLLRPWALPVNAHTSAAITSTSGV
jgi:hypothetical protein